MSSYANAFAPVRERASAIVIHHNSSVVAEASPEDLALDVRLWRAAGILGVKSSTSWSLPATAARPSPVLTLGLFEGEAGVFARVV